MTEIIPKQHEKKKIIAEIPEPTPQRPKPTVVIQ